MKHYFLSPFIGIILSLILVVAINANPNLPDIKDSISEKIGDKTLVVKNFNNGYPPRWFISSKTGLRRLKNPPATELHVDTIKASGDKEYLAVLSAGEGHPEIRIYKLKKILDDRDSEALYSIDPYPGIVDLIEWEDHSLHIKSNIFLTETLEQFGRIPDALALFSLESFLVNIDTGKIEAVAGKLKNTVNYYGTHLIDTPDEYSPLTELLAFSELNDIKAIPYLKQALKMKRYSKNKKEINELLLKLKGHFF